MFLGEKQLSRYFISDDKIIKFSTMNKKNKKPSFNKDRVMDLSKQDDFLFNKTPILSSALQRLKKGDGKAKKAKRIPDRNIEEEEPELKKKVKRSLEQMVPSLVYSPLQKDLFNFYTVNKSTLRNMDKIHEPKFEVGSFALIAICDRGIGGKFLVGNMYRNKKAYIDYKDISEIKSKKNEYEAIEAYKAPGDYVVGNVIKGRDSSHIQMRLCGWPALDTKVLRPGQVIIGEVKSKQELGCLISSSMCGWKIFLPKEWISEEIFADLEVKKQVLTVVKEIKKNLLKVGLITQEKIFMSIEEDEQQMGKMEMQQLFLPGTLLNAKVVSNLSNGLIIKFCKIFTGFIHADHLNDSVDSYNADQKVQVRVIYHCLNPPFLYLSEHHVDLTPYFPSRSLYTPVSKPEQLTQIQNSFLNYEQEIFIHGTQLHSEIQNIGRLWVKQNNYFEKYQMMSSTKLGLRVGEIAKNIPFTNFKIIGEGKGNKFRVMCLDVWNKVVKVSYNTKIMQAKNIISDLENVQPNQLYCGFIKSITNNGVIIEFYNNIKGLLPHHELKMKQIKVDEESLGQGIEVYVREVKKNFMTLSLVNENIRTKRKKEPIINQEMTEGIIQSVNSKSIHPIYIKLKNHTIAKVSVFKGIRPASTNNLPLIRDLQTNFQVGQKVKVFRKNNKFYLYPPEQLKDENLRICRVVSRHGCYVRLQTGEDQFKNCHICQVSDLIVPHPLMEVSLNQYHIGRVLPNDSISLRSSIVMHGIPKSMKQCLELYSEDEKRGDYRNRILTVGNVGLSQNMVVFGYIKSFNDKGCFISLTSDCTIRVQLCQLTDQHITDKQKHYLPNKLILCRIINKKVKHGSNNMYLFDGSARESIVKMGYPINDDVLMVGLGVKGMVSGYVKGKLLVKLDGSQFTGIMGVRDIEGLEEEGSLEKNVPLGTKFTMKVIQYENKGGKRLIRLSTLPKYFKKYEGVELEAQEDKRVVSLWQHYQSMLKEEVIIRQEEKVEEEEEIDEYARMEGLLNKELMGGENPDDYNIQQIEEEIQPIEEADEMEEQNMEQQQYPQQPLDQQQQQPLDQEANQPMPNLQTFKKMQHSLPVYQELLLANASFESHLQYISALAQSSQATPQQIREQFKKSIDMLTTIEEKENMWIAWLNMEVVLGALTTTIKKALESGVGLKVYMRVVQVLREQENWQLALQFSKKMLKKFNKDPKAYTAYLKNLLLLQGKHEVHTTVKEVFRRAEQCLTKANQVLMQVQYAKMLYQEQQAERGRNILDELHSKLPKRTDIWCMHVDLELKHNCPDRAREVLERALTVQLKKKKIVTLLNKYHQVEKNYGTAATVKALESRAQQIAQKYHQNQSSSDSE